MIGGLKFPRAGGIGVNANEVEDLPIWLLLSPLTTGFLSKSVGARRTALPRPPETVAAATRACLAISCSLGCNQGQKGLPFTETDRTRHDP